MICFELEGFAIFLVEISKVQHDAGLVGLHIVVGIVVIIVDDEHLPVWHVTWHILEPLLVDWVCQDVIVVNVHQVTSESSVRLFDGFVSFIGHHFDFEFPVVVFFLDGPFFGVFAESTPVRVAWLGSVNFWHVEHGEDLAHEPMSSISKEEHKCKDQESKQKRPSRSSPT